MPSRRLSRRIGIVLGVVVALLVGSSVFAQGPNPLAQVGAKLDQILALLSPEEPRPVTLTTGILVKNLNTEAMVCYATNAGSEPLVVSFKLRTHLGEVVSEATESIAPGQSGPFFPVGIANWGFYRCEFSFIGVPNDLRATGQLVDFAIHKTLVVLEAH